MSFVGLVIKKNGLKTAHGRLDECGYLTIIRFEICQQIKVKIIEFTYYSNIEYKYFLTRKTLDEIETSLHYLYKSLQRLKPSVFVTKS